MYFWSNFLIGSILFTILCYLLESSTVECKLLADYKKLDLKKLLKHSKLTKSGLIVELQDNSYADADSIHDLHKSVKNAKKNKRILNKFLRDKKFALVGTVNKDSHDIELVHAANSEEAEATQPKGIPQRRASCAQGAAKACSKACNSVLKNVCNEFKCASGMKSRFKAECKKNCAKKFGV